MFQGDVGYRGLSGTRQVPAQKRARLAVDHLRKRCPAVRAGPDPRQFRRPSLIRRGGDRRHGFDTASISEGVRSKDRLASATVVLPWMIPMTSAVLRFAVQRLLLSSIVIPFQQRFFPTCYGCEFISRDLDLWAYANEVTLDFSCPGKPLDNGFIEAFNSERRAECLNAHRFLSVVDAQEELEDWPLLWIFRKSLPGSDRHDNEDRPHIAIGYNVPIAVHYSDDVTGP